MIAPSAALSLADAAELIRAATERMPGVQLERVAESHGRYAAVFGVWPNPTYCKGVATRWHAELNELLSSVLDTLEHTQGDMDMNVFSSAMRCV